MKSQSETLLKSSVTIRYDAPRAPPFVAFMNQRGLSIREVYRDPTKYRNLYAEYLRILHPIALNLECRYQMMRGCNWKLDEIRKLANYYKDQFNEDWLI